MHHLTIDSTLEIEREWGEKKATTTWLNETIEIKNNKQKQQIILFTVDLFSRVRLLCCLCVVFVIRSALNFIS